MDILDFRLRPPSHSYLDLRIYTRERITWFAELLAVPPPQAALNRSMKEFWGELAEAGIKLGVMNGRDCPEPHGIVTNEDVADLQRQFPDKLIGTGGVRLARDNSLAQVDHAIKELGLRGIAIDPGFNDPPMYSSAPEVYAVARRCAEYKVPLIINSSTVAGPDVSYAEPVHIDRLAAACPETTIVVSHGCWPNAQAMCGVAFRRGNVYVSPDMYMMRCPGVPDYVMAMNTFLADRFLFGSAYPSCAMKPLVDYYAELPIKDSVRPKVMYQNAARLLGLA